MRGCFIGSLFFWFRQVFSNHIKNIQLNEKNQVSC